MKTVEITDHYAPRTSEAARPANAQAARSRLEEGNRAFASLVESLTSESATSHRTIEVDLDDLGLQPGEQGIPRQRPFAAVLGCSDARVLIELIFNEGPNDLFVVRVAGNGLGTTYSVACGTRSSTYGMGCGLWSGTQWLRRETSSQGCTTATLMIASVCAALTRRSYLSCVAVRGYQACAASALSCDSLGAPVMQVRRPARNAALGALSLGSTRRVISVTLLMAGVDGLFAMKRASAVCATI